MGGVAGGLGAAFDMVEGAGAFGGCSFTPQTTVLMADGSREPISKLKPGDLVEAYDPATGKTGPHRVTAVMVNRDPATEHLVLDTGAVETTPNHPFYTPDRGWVEAGQLRAGEHVRTATGTDAVVVRFTVDPHPARMWDITVDGAHSFFVGSGKVLVHNCEELQGPQLTPRLGDVGQVTGPDVAQAPGGQLGAQEMFDWYASQPGVTILSKPTYSGTMVQLADGSTVGLRTSATGPVLDFNGSVSGYWRLHFTSP